VVIQMHLCVPSCQTPHIGNSTNPGLWTLDSLNNVNFQDQNWILISSKVLK